MPAEVEFTGIPEGEYQVHLARSATEAAHGYLDRVAVVVPAGFQAGRPALSARVQEVHIQFLCPSDPRLVRHGLVSLTRVDDPHWHPPQRPLATALHDPMLMTDEDGLLHLRDLGPGRYALELTGLVGEGEPPGFQFQVPGPERLEITFQPR